MLENYNDDVEILLTWHERLKEAAIIAESLDTSNSSYIQPMHEQRYSYDHFVRAICFEKGGESEEKIKKALSSALGHLQRGYSDTIEWICVSVLDEYTVILDDFTAGQIERGFPDYYAKIRPDLDKIKNQINNYKINKSVEEINGEFSTQEKAELSKMSSQYLSEDLVYKLKQYVETLHEKQGTLLEIARRDKKEQRRKMLKEDILLPLVTGVIGALAGALMTQFFT